MRFGTGRRRRIIVDKPFQYRVTLAGIFYLVVIAVCFTLPLHNMIRSTTLLLRDGSPELIELYRTQQQYTVISFILFFIGIMLAWVVFTLWRTHKIAGPIVKVTRHIHDISTGDFSKRVKLRSQDELQALSESLNHLADSLEHRDRVIKDRFREQLQMLKMTLFNSSSTDRSAKAVDNLAKRIDECFDTPPQQPETGEPERDEDPAEDVLYS